MFLQIWENWGDPFSKHYKILDRQYWNDFWDNCPYTQKEVYKALRNIYYCVNNGHYGRQYISKDPCKFIQGGMLDRGLSTSIADWWSMYHKEDDPNLEKTER